MVWAYFPLYYVYSFPFTQCPYYFSYIFPLVFKKYLPPVLWRKYYVVLTIPFGSCDPLGVLLFSATWRNYGAYMGLSHD